MAQNGIWAVGAWQLPKVTQKCQNFDKLPELLNAKGSERQRESMTMYDTAYT